MAMVYHHVPHNLRETSSGLITMCAHDIWSENIVYIYIYMSNCTGVGTSQTLFGENYGG